MARMLGKTQWHQMCSYGCCVSYVGTVSAKRQEDVQWRKEAEDEMEQEQDGV